MKKIVNYLLDLTEKEIENYSYGDAFVVIAALCFAFFGMFLLTYKSLV